MYYDESISTRKIPAAAITIEDAEMFARMQRRGQIITLELLMENELVPDCTSYNLVVDLKGKQLQDGDTLPE